MSGHVVPLRPSTHRTVQRLLPWFVTDTLDAAEMSLVRDHLRTCAQCQADVELQRRLRAAYPRPVEMPHVDQAFSRLKQRLEQRPERLAPRGKRAQAARFQSLRDAFLARAPWMRWALAAQAGVIALLAILLALPPGALFDQTASYRGLGSAPRASGNIVAVFKPDTTEQELRRILRESEARLVDGPTVAGAYVLAVDASRQKRAIEMLRSSPAVRLVEPLTSRKGG